jgi:hypothetical protein
MAMLVKLIRLRSMDCSNLNAQVPASLAAAALLLSVNAREQTGIAALGV